MRRTGGRAPSPTRACRFSNRRSRRPARSTARRCSRRIANGGPWDTISGPIDLKTHIREKQWGVGQWQNGQFVGVSPSDMAGAEAGRVSQAGVVTPSRRRVGVVAGAAADRACRARCARRRRRADMPVIEVILGGVILGGLYALVAHGIQPAIRRGAHRESRLWRVPDDRRLRGVLDAHPLRHQPDCWACRCRSPRRSARTGSSTAVLMDSAGAPRPHPRSTRGRDHSRNLRTAVRAPRRRHASPLPPNDRYYDYLGEPLQSSASLSPPTACWRS